jgi:O-antigen ligase
VATLGSSSVNSYRSIIQVSTILALALGLGYILSISGIQGAGMVAALPVGLVFLYILFSKPIWGLYTYIVCSYFIVGVIRYVNAPAGLAIDFVLFLTAIAIIFTGKKEDLAKANNPMTWIVVLWFLYTAALVANPEAKSLQAWFYAIRGLSGYFAIAIPLIFILMDKKKDLNLFLKLYFIFTVVTAIWGIKQRYYIDWAEQRWLDSGSHLTHIIDGKLRVFSFLSDAGQFGALMAHAIIICVIFGLAYKDLRRKIIFGSLSAFFLISLAISGSRGPVLIVFAGLAVYLMLVQNFRLLVGGMIIGGGAFFFLAYTSIGQDQYEIRRLRTALDPNDASFQVRLENQKKLRVYLANKPFGGGVGSGGNWGERFTPNTFLAQTPYDSWYVKVWVETGIIGLVLYGIMHVIILILGFIHVNRVKEPILRAKGIALYAGFVGVLVGSYGNQIYGQMVISCLISYTLVYMYIIDKMDDTIVKENTEHVKKSLY